MVHFSYDYTEFLSEFREEIEDGTLTLGDELLVLRGQPVGPNYRPIEDWYYSEERMYRIFNSTKPTDDEYRRIQGDKARFSTIFEKLEPITVRAVIAEMEQLNSFIGAEEEDGK